MKDNYWKMKEKKMEQTEDASRDYAFKLSKWIYKKFLSKRIFFVEKDYSVNEGRLLDLGCGTGFFANAFKSIGYEVRMCDLRPLNKNIDKVDLEKDKLHYPDNYFDVIFCRNIIEHLSNADNMLKESFRVLKTKGRIIIITEDAYYWSSLRMILNHYDHKKAYTMNAVSEGLEMFGFNVIVRKSFRNIPYIWRYTDLAFEKVYPFHKSMIVIGEKI